MTLHMLETARKLGEVFATTLNGTPNAAYWNRLDSSDNVPERDYIAMSKQFGECPREMKRAYREGFNNTFNPLNVGCMVWWTAMSEAERRNVMFHAETTDIAKAWAWHKRTQIEDAGGGRLGERLRFPCSIAAGGDLQQWVKLGLRMSDRV
jgi:hypothetical protein